MKLTPEEEAELRDRLKNNHLVSQFIESGEELLKATNRPNIITVAQFMPYIELFQTRDPQRAKTDIEYKRRLERLSWSWKVDLGMNLFELTHIIESEANPKIIHTLNRAMTQIKSDLVKNPRRDSLPQLPRTASVTQDEVSLAALLTDIKEANFDDPQMRAHFQQVRAITEKLHVRDKELKQGKVDNNPTSPPADSTTEPTSQNDAIVWDNGDDDD